MGKRAQSILPPTASGNAWLISNEDPATVPVPIPIIIVAVEGPYTERDRKLWTFLLHAVWDELGTKDLHSIPIREINDMFRALGGDHNANWIWESAERLTRTIIKWQGNQGDKRYKGISAMFGAVLEEESRKEGILHFHFPPLLVPVLKDPRRFARLRTHFLIQLSGKYAVTLYEVLETAANKNNPVVEVELSELRQWLKIPAGKLPRWQDMRRRCIEPALSQINGSPDGAGFTTSFEVTRQGKAPKKIRFIVTKTRQRLEIEEKLSWQQPHLAPPNGIHLRPETFAKAKQYTPGWDIYALKADWEKWGQATSSWPPENPDAAFMGFCKKKGPYSVRKV